MLFKFLFLLIIQIINNIFKLVIKYQIREEFQGIIVFNNLYISAHKKGKLHIYSLSLIYIFIHSFQFFEFIDLCNIFSNLWKKTSLLGNVQFICGNHLNINKTRVRLCLQVLN